MDEKNMIVEVEDRYGEYCFADSTKVVADERRPRGVVNIFEVEEDGTKKLIEKSNLVLYQGREVVASSMFGVQNPFITATPNEQISWFGLGTGGAPSGSPFDPIPPNSTDTDLNSAIMINATDSTCAGYSSILSGYTKHPFDSVIYQPDPANNNAYLIVQVVTTIGLDDAVGQQINEAGLYAAASAAGGYAGAFHLFAKVTFPTIYKSNTRELLFVWYLYV